MTRTRFPRIVALSLLLVSLVLVPVSVDAAPRDGHDDAGAFALLGVAWDWISNLWGAGGGNWDPHRIPSLGSLHQGPEPKEAKIASPSRSGSLQHGADGLRAATR